MLSFIVIGYNEGENLGKCFSSIYEAIAFTGLKVYEIIYVDSGSTDDSIKIAAEFSEISIYKITGFHNAAVGRNIGAIQAKGDVLYFIDGDREIYKEFLGEVLDAEKNLKYDVVSGEVTDIEKHSTDAGKYIEKKRPFMQTQLHDGGSFLIKKTIWTLLKGMRTKFTNGEDGDLGLRLAKKGFRFTHINKTIAIHHTVNYFDKSRIWKMVLSKSFFQCRCVLYRDHWANKYLYPRIWSDDKTFLLLIIVLCSAIILPVKGILIAIAVYLAAVFFRSLKRERYLSVAGLFIYFIIFDFLNIIFLFTLFPGNKKPEYIEIKKSKL